MLPIQNRKKYKLCLIAFKIVNNAAPQYLTDTTYFYRPLRENLRIGKARFILNLIQFKFILIVASNKNTNKILIETVCSAGYYDS